MKYLLKHKNNSKYESSGELCFLDCSVTLLNHFEQNKNEANFYIIDLLFYDKMDMIIIKSMLEQIKDISPKSIIFIIGENDFSLTNVHLVHSVEDIPF